MRCAAPVSWLKYTASSNRVLLKLFKSLWCTIYLQHSSLVAQWLLVPGDCSSSTSGGEKI